MYETFLLFYTTFIIVLIGLTLFAVYRFLKPINLIKDLREVGYDHLYEDISNKKRKLSRRTIVYNARKQRVFGNIPPVYPNGWFALIDSIDLQIGDVKHISAIGENFAVFRSTNGKVHILDAFCPHLGANLAIGGAVEGNCIECPFHGWKFDGSNGQCVSIPYAEKIPEQSKVRHWHSLEVNTLIFVWYHAEGEDPNWYPETIPEIEFNTWWYRGRNEYYINCHIQEIPENGADIIHLNVLHGSFVFSGNNMSKIKNSLLNNIVRHNWYSSWNANLILEKPHIANLEMDTELTLFNKFKLSSVNIKCDQIGPGYVVMNINSAFGPIKILQTVTPIEPLQQKVTHKFFYPLKASIYGTLLFFSEKIMFERDILIWNHKTYKEKPVLTKEEYSIVKYRRWYSQFYSKNSPRINTANSSLQW